MEKTVKSPNRLWRESGSSLSFADWIQREKEKSNFMVNKKFLNFTEDVSNETNSDATWLQDSLNQAKIDLGIEKPKDTKPDNTFIGLNKTVLMLSALIIVGAIFYKVYEKRK